MRLRGTYTHTCPLCKLFEEESDQYRYDSRRGRRGRSEAVTKVGSENPADGTTAIICFWTKRLGTAADEYISGKLIGSDTILEATLAVNTEAKLPAFDVAPN